MVDWKLDKVYDTFVKPDRPIVDYNTRYTLQPGGCMQNSAVPGNTCTVKKSCNEEELFNANFIILSKITLARAEPFLSGLWIPGHAEAGTI